VSFQWCPVFNWSPKNLGMDFSKKIEWRSNHVTHIEIESFFRTHFKCVVIFWDKTEMFFQNRTHTTRKEKTVSMTVHLDTPAVFSIVCRSISCHVQNLSVLYLNFKKSRARILFFSGCYQNSDSKRNTKVLCQIASK